MRLREILLLLVVDEDSARALVICIRSPCVTLWLHCAGSSLYCKKQTYAQKEHIFVCSPAEVARADAEGGIGHLMEAGAERHAKPTSWNSDLAGSQWFGTQRTSSVELKCSDCIFQEETHGIFKE